MQITNFKFENILLYIQKNIPTKDIKILIFGILERFTQCLESQTRDTNVFQNSLTSPSRRYI